MPLPRSFTHSANLLGMLATEARIVSNGILPRPSLISFASHQYLRCFSPFWSLCPCEPKYLQWYRDQGSEGGDFWYDRVQFCQALQGLHRLYVTSALICIKTDYDNTLHSWFLSTSSGIIRTAYDIYLALAPYYCARHMTHSASSPRRKAGSDEFFVFLEQF